MDGYEAREIYRNFLTASCIVVVLDKKETAAVSKCEYFRSQWHGKQCSLGVGRNMLSHLSFSVIAPANNKYCDLKQESLNLLVS